MRRHGLSLAAVERWTDLRPWNTERSPTARLEALLGRLDRIAEELQRLNRREERREELAVIAHELQNLNESLRRSPTRRSGRRARRCAAAGRANRL